MDPSFGQQQQPQLDLSKLSDYEKRELQQSLTNEMQKAHIQSSVHNITDVCWKKCITGKISAATLSGSETSCTQDCVERFIDANEAAFQHLNRMRVQGGL